MFRAIILFFLSHGFFPGKVKQNPTMQTQKLSAIDYLIKEVLYELNTIDMLV